MAAEQQGRQRDRGRRVASHSGNAPASPTATGYRAVVSAVRPQRPGRLVMMTLLAGGLVGLGIWAAGQTDAWLAAHWTRQLDQLPDAEAARRVEWLGRLGEAGQAGLLEALGDSRAAVHYAAREALNARLAEWEAAEAVEALPLLRLAKSLHARYDHYPPAARQVAAELAGRILAWPRARGVHAVPVARRGELLLALDSVIRRAASERTRDFDRQRLLAPRGGELAAADFPPSPGVASHPVAGTALPDPSQLGSLPPAAGTLARRDAGSSAVPLPRSAVPAPRMSPPNEPSLVDRQGLPVEVAAVPALPTPGVLGPQPLPGTLQEPGLLAEDQPRRSPPPTAAPGDDRSDAEPQRLVGAPLPGAVPRPEPLQSSMLSGSVRSEPTLQLIRALTDPDAQRASTAHGELVRRGFQPVHFWLAAQLNDPDADARLVLARKLAAIEGVDVRPWLIWLSEDVNPRVRLSAVSLMATHSDDGFARRLRDMLASETDQRVRSAIERIQATPRP